MSIAKVNGEESELSEAENDCDDEVQQQGEFKSLCESKVEHDAKLLEASVKLISMDELLRSVMSSLERIEIRAGKQPEQSETDRRSPHVSSSSVLHRAGAEIGNIQLDTRSSLFRKIEMPVFDGSQPCEWFSKVERFFRIGHYQDQEKLDLVFLSFEGDALKWFKWEMFRHEFHSWDDFRERFGDSMEEDPSTDSLLETNVQVKSTLNKELSATGSSTHTEELLHVMESIDIELSHEKELKASIPQVSHQIVALSQRQVPVSDLEQSHPKKLLGVIRRNLVIEHRSVGNLAEQFSVFHVKNVDELYPKLSRVKAKSFAHQLFGTRFLSDKRGDELNKQSKFSKTWKFKFKHKVETLETVKEQDEIVEYKEEKKSEEEQDDKLWDSSATRAIKRINFLQRDSCCFSQCNRSMVWTEAIEGFLSLLDNYLRYSSVECIRR